MTGHLYVEAFIPVNANRLPLSCSTQPRRGRISLGGPMARGLGHPVRQAGYAVYVVDPPGDRRARASTSLSTTSQK
jgi:hypothetical protein